MAETVLNASLRERVGKGGSRALRREEKIPAVVYGKGMDTCSMVVDPKELKAALSTEAGLNALITLKGDGPFDGKVVILKDMQVHPIRRDLTHADFQAIDLSQKVLVMVPVQPMGKSEGEKAGGQLQVIRHELEVSCLPTAIPKAIEIDVTALSIGDVVHVEDVTLEGDVEIPHDVNFTVLTVVGVKAEASEEEAEEEAGEAAEEGAAEASGEE